MSTLPGGCENRKPMDGGKSICTRGYRWSWNRIKSEGWARQQTHQKQWPSQFIWFSGMTWNRSQNAIDWCTTNNRHTQVKSMFLCWYIEKMHLMDFSILHIFLTWTVYLFTYTLREYPLVSQKFPCVLFEFLLFFSFF